MIDSLAFFDAINTINLQHILRQSANQNDDVQIMV